MTSANPKLIRRLSKMGTSYCLYLDKAVVNLLQITPEMDFELSTDGQSLLCKPVREQGPPGRLLKHFNTVGGATCLYLDRVLMALLGIVPEKDDVEVLTDGAALVIRQARVDIKRAEEIADSIDHINANQVVFTGSGEAAPVASKKKAKKSGAASAPSE